MKDKYYKKAFDLVIKHIDKYGYVCLTSIRQLDKYLEEAKKSMELSKLEKKHLKEDIEYLGKATGHQYTDITYYTDGLYPSVSFTYKSKRHKEFRSDSIGGSPCYTQKLEVGKMYDLKELLDGYDKG